MGATESNLYMFWTEQPATLGGSGFAEVLVTNLKILCVCVEGGVYLVCVCVHARSGFLPSVTTDLIICLYVNGIPLKVSCYKLQQRREAETGST